HRGGRGADEQFFLSGWGGQSWSVDRKGTHADGPILIPHVHLSVFGGVQPAQLYHLQRKASEGNGFVERLLFCYPDPRSSPSWTWDEVTDDLNSAWQETVARLWDLEPQGRVLTMTAEAREGWERENLNFDTLLEDVPQGVETAAPKLREYAARLAVILHCLHEVCRPGAARATLPQVDAAAIRGGWALARYFLAHAQRVYSRPDNEEGFKAARVLLKWIVAKLVSEPDFRLTASKIHGNVKGRALFAKKEDLDEALKVLVDHKYLRSGPSDNRSGPKTTVYLPRPGLAELQIE